jgi:hypothetical protein
VVKTVQRKVFKKRSSSSVVPDAVPVVEAPQKKLKGPPVELPVIQEKKPEYFFDPNFLTHVVNCPDSALVVTADEDVHFSKFLKKGIEFKIGDNLYLNQADGEPFVAKLMDVFKRNGQEMISVAW